MAEFTISGNGVEWCKQAGKTFGQNLKAGAAELGRILQSERSEIVKRTAGGKDAEGGTFAKYSKPYAKYKAKKLGSAAVTLRETGQMLQAVQVTSGATEAGIEGRISVLNSGRKGGSTNAALARYHNEGTGKLPRRHWFDLSKEQAERVYKKIKDLIGKYV